MNTLKIGFKLILSLSLIFVPSYSYSNNNSVETNDNSIETFISRLETEYKKTQAELPAELQEASQILREMGTALTENRLINYIGSRPELNSRFDILSLNNQQVEVLDYREQTTSDINFNNESNISLSYKRILQNIDVEFNSEGKLIFKGVVVSEDKELKLEKKSGLIHVFQNIEKKDVIDWVYDKDLLIILHKRKGLILYHVMFARELLGSTPIPSFSLPVSSDLLNKKNIKLEFIDRTIIPPGTLLGRQTGVDPAVDQTVVSSTKAVKDTDVSYNLDGKPMFFAGDLLISYQDSEGKKKIARVLSRSKDLVPALANMYRALSSLIQIKDFTLDSNSNSYFGKQIMEEIRIVLSATFNRKSISFFNKFADLINIMPYFLVYKTVDRNPDSFLHTEWHTDYQKIKEKSPELFDKISKTEGNTISSDEIAKALKPIVEEKKQGFKRLLSHVGEKYPKTSKLINGIKDGIKGSSIEIILFLGAFLLVINQTINRPNIGESSNHLSNAINDMVLLGVGLLLSVYVLSLVSIPVLKGIKVLLPPGELKLTIEQTIEKWGAKNIRERDKIAAVGFKVAAMLLPLFLRVFQISGQRHLFSTLASGINPFEKINLNSSLGRAVGLKRPMRLGIGQSFGGKRHQQRSELIDLVNEQRRKVDTLSKIMTYYALSHKNFDIKLVLTGPLALDKNFGYTDKKVMRNFAWVSQELSKYILKSQKIDTTKSIFSWDIAVINNDFYQKALNLTQEVKSLSWTQKQISELSKITNQAVRKGLNWNTEHARVLMSYYPERAVGDQFWKGLILDHLILVILPLTSFTPRGDFFSGNISGSAIESHTLFRSSPPHMHEAGLNISQHIILTFLQQLQYLTLKKSDKLKHILKEIDSLYQPITRFSNETKNIPGTFQYLWDAIKFPGANWGKKIYAGEETQEERIDIGFYFWKRIKLSVRIMFIATFIGVLSREFFTPEYSLWANIVGTLFFIGGSFWYFGWPELWARFHHMVFDKRVGETKERIDQIKLITRKIEKRLYTSSAELNVDYEKALDNLKGLYYSSKKFQKTGFLDKVDPKIKEFILQDFTRDELNEFIKSQTIEQKREQLQIIPSLLNTKALPTEVSQHGLTITMLLSLGIYSNLAFVYLSEKSFSDVTFLGFLKLYGGYVALGYGLNRLSSKSIPHRVREVKSGIKKMGEMGASVKGRCVSAFKNLNLKQ